MPLWLIKLGAPLFDFGKSLTKISWKVWAVLATIIFFVITIWWVENKVSDHQKYVAGLEKSNQELTQVRDRLNSRVKELGSINTQNRLVYNQKLQQAQEARRIADEEAQQALARAEYYRSIRNAATNTPEADRRPVDPVILDTIDRLWDDTPRN